MLLLHGEGGGGRLGGKSDGELLFLGLVVLGGAALVLGIFELALSQHALHDGGALVVLVLKKGLVHELLQALLEELPLQQTELRSAHFLQQAGSWRLVR